MSDIYVISDDDNNLLSLGVKMFGVDVTMPAIFLAEDMALNILFEIEKIEVLPRPHGVKILSSHLVEALPRT